MQDMSVEFLMNAKIRLSHPMLLEKVLLLCRFARQSREWFAYIFHHWCHTDLLLKYASNLLKAAQERSI